MTQHAGVDDLVRVYLDEIARYPLLSPDAEVALGRTIEKGRVAEERLQTQPPRSSAQRAALRRAVAAGDRARTEFIDANLRLVVAIARRYQRQGVALLDLIQDGNVGLMKAVERWDWQRGLRFSTYATWWIRSMMTKGLNTSSRTVRLPIHTAERARLLRRIADEFVVTCGHLPSALELAEASGSSEEEVRLLLAASRDAVSLSMPLADTDGGELGDVVADADASTPEEEAEVDAVSDEVVELLRTLSRREAEVIGARFGLRGRTWTLEQVADRLGVSRERARQIEARAMGKLRRAADASGARSLLSA